MKIAILTANAIRHKYVVNELCRHSFDTLAVVETKVPIQLKKSEGQNAPSRLIAEHFQNRDLAEKKFFQGNDNFISKCLLLDSGMTNSDYCYGAIKEFNPDLILAFGSPIIREPLLSLMPAGRFINLHLGLSPYYRGSGTNFWPFVNQELDYVGATILHINAGIDTGDIITHVRPEISKGDDVHTIGCKVIRDSVQAIIELARWIQIGQELPRMKQWKEENEKYYRQKDFNEEILKKYYQLMSEGLVEKYLARPKKNLRLINVFEPSA